MDSLLTQLKPEILIQGGAVVVAIILAFTNRSQSKSLSTILGNHLKHIEEKQDEDIQSRVRLAEAVGILNNNIQFHLVRKDNEDVKPSSNQQ